MTTVFSFFLTSSVDEWLPLRLVLSYTRIQQTLAALPRLPGDRRFHFWLILAQFSQGTTPFRGHSPVSYCKIGYPYSLALLFLAAVFIPLE